jgi:hypothetical protein
MAERYKLSGIRPKAVVIRFYDDGGYEEFWELATSVLSMHSYRAPAEPHAPPRLIVDTLRIPPGPIPPLPGS